MWDGIKQGFRATKCWCNFWDPTLEIRFPIYILGPWSSFMLRRWVCISRTWATWTGHADRQSVTDMFYHISSNFVKSKVTQPAGDWPNLVAGTLRHSGGGESKYSIGLSQTAHIKDVGCCQAFPARISSWACRTSPWQSPMKSSGWLLAIFLGRHVPQAIYQGVHSLSNHSQESKAHGCGPWKYCQEG